MWAFKVNIVVIFLKIDPSSTYMKHALRHGPLGSYMDHALKEEFFNYMHGVMFIRMDLLGAQCGSCILGWSFQSYTWVVHCLICTYTNI
jgi:hypothetical protein